MVIRFDVWVGSFGGEVGEHAYFFQETAGHSGDVIVFLLIHRTHRREKSDWWVTGSSFEKWLVGFVRDKL